MVEMHWMVQDEEEDAMPPLKITTTQEKETACRRLWFFFSGWSARTDASCRIAVVNLQQGEGGDIQIHPHFVFFSFFFLYLTEPVLFMVPGPLCLSSHFFSCTTDLCDAYIRLV